jgi:hypothetical protein
VTIIGGTAGKLERRPASSGHLLSVFTRRPMKGLDAIAGDQN